MDYNRDAKSVSASLERLLSIGLSKKALYDSRKEAHICVNCGAPELVNNTHCRECWFVDKASVQAGGAANIDAIIGLWNDQNGRCFYSGEVLVPGKNASLDHQVPQSKGGLNHPSNLRWVSTQINLMKTDMTHDEFITMCKQIVFRFTGE